jgi:hypothetical protein
MKTGLSVNIPDSNFGGVRLKSRLGQGYTAVVRGSHQSLRANAGMVPRLGHESFLPNLFQFIDHLTIRRYVV